MDLGGRGSPEMAAPSSSRQETRVACSERRWRGREGRGRSRDGQGRTASEKGRVVSQQRCPRDLRGQQLLSKTQQPRARLPHAGRCPGRPCRRGQSAAVPVCGGTANSPCRAAGPRFRRAASGGAERDEEVGGEPGATRRQARGRGHGAGGSGGSGGSGPGTRARALSVAYLPTLPSSSELTVQVGALPRSLPSGRPEQRASPRQAPRAAGPRCPQHRPPLPQ